MDNYDGTFGVTFNMFSIIRNLYELFDVEQFEIQDEGELQAFGIRIWKGRGKNYCEIATIWQECSEHTREEDIKGNMGDNNDGGW